MSLALILTTKVFDMPYMTSDVTSTDTYTKVFDMLCMISDVVSTTSDVASTDTYH